MTEETEEKKKPPVTTAASGDTTVAKDSIGTWEGNPKLRRILGASRPIDVFEEKKE